MGTNSERPALAERVFRFILRWYPRDYRARHEVDQLRAFRLLRQEAVERGRIAGWMFGLRECSVLAAHAAMARRRRPGARTSPRKRSMLFAAISQDATHAVRSLIRAPGFAVVVIVTLGLGIGANTAVFSVVNGVLLRSLPYDQADKLLFVWDDLGWIGVPRAWGNPREFLDLRERMMTFEGIAAIDQSQSELAGEGGAPQVLRTGVTTGNLFEILRSQALLGRTLTPADEDPGAEPVVVLNHGLWVTRYGADPRVLGRTVILDDQPTTVVGVMPPEFTFQVHSSQGSPVRPDAWLPQRGNLAEEERGSHWLAILARIRDDVPNERALAELATVSAAYDEEFYRSHGFAFQPAPLHDDLVKDVRPVLLVLLGAVGFVLLIVSANIATLMLARAQSRDREFAVRRSLGARPGRLTGQLIIEGLVVSLVGGTAGFLVAGLTIDLLIAIAPSGLPRMETVGVDPTVFLFSLGVATVIGVLSALAPALHVSSEATAQALRDGVRVGGGGRARRARQVLVAGEFALAVVLLTGTGLMIQSFLRLQSVDPGFETEALTVRIPLVTPRYDEPEVRARFVHRLVDETLNLPGVLSAGVTSAAPLGAEANQWPAFREEAGETDGSEMQRETVDVIAVTPGLMESLGVPLLSGRPVAPTDVIDAPPVVLVDPSLAQVFWPGEDPVGKQVRLAGVTRTVVGTARPIRQYEVHQDGRPQVYLPFDQRPRFIPTLVVRHSGDVAAVATGVRRVVSRLDPNQAVADVRSVADIVGGSLAERRFTMQLMTAFGLAAMLLAAIGLYGVTTYTVARQTREIGIRMALGANRSTVVTMVLGQAGRLVAVGLGLGLVGAAALSGLVRNMVYGVPARDPLTLMGVAATLVVVAGLAVLVPARRATRVQPVRALRQE